MQKSNWLDWKWQQATTKDGATVGLGTDIGPMAICYREDVFEKAGLPTDREEVSKLWAGDWKKFIAAGEQYKKGAGKDTYFMDSPGGLINAILSSEDEKFYDASGKVIYKTNPAVKDAFDLTAEAAEKGLVQSQTQFQPAWDQTISNSLFTTVACPPWMLGTIKAKSQPDSAGKWDVAAPKAGNWGGTSWACPSRQAREGGAEAGHLADRARAAGQALLQDGQLPERARRVQAPPGDRRQERHDR
ncbi:hypothetical protein STENM327S_05180 [Streptomyces tendae]